jgi:uncharacterized membrane protein
MRNRSVIEIMVITFTFVVALMIVGLGFMIIYVEARHPEADTALIANTLMSLVSGILGALLGLIAGRATGDTLHQRADGSTDDVEPGQ